MTDPAVPYLRTRDERRRRRNAFAVAILAVLVAFGTGSLVVHARTERAHDRLVASARTAASRAALPAPSGRAADPFDVTLRREPHVRLRHRPAVRLAGGDRPGGPRLQAVDGDLPFTFLAPRAWRFVSSGTAHGRQLGTEPDLLYRRVTDNGETGPHADLAAAACGACTTADHARFDTRWTRHLAGGAVRLDRRTRGVRWTERTTGGRYELLASSVYTAPSGRRYLVGWLSSDTPSHRAAARAVADAIATAAAPAP